MKLQDISYWGIVKVTLFVTIFLPLIGLIALAPFALINPDSVTYSVTNGDIPKLFGIIGFDFEGLPLWVSTIIVGFLNLLVASKILQIIAKLTPIGRIEIGPPDEEKISLPNKAPTPPP